MSRPALIQKRGAAIGRAQLQRVQADGTPSQRVVVQKVSHLSGAPSSNGLSSGRFEVPGPNGWKTGKWPATLVKPGASGKERRAFRVIVPQRGRCSLLSAADAVLGCRSVSVIESASKERKFPLVTERTLRSTRVGSETCRRMLPMNTKSNLPPSASGATS